MLDKNTTSIRLGFEGGPKQILGCSLRICVRVCVCVYVSLLLLEKHYKVLTVQCHIDVAC